MEREYTDYGGTDREFDKSFRIPKRKADSDSQEATISYSQQERRHYGPQQGVLADSYYNTQYPQNMAMYGCWPQGNYYQGYQDAPGCNDQNATDSVTQKIYSTLSEQKERPKTYNNNIFKETAPDADDSTLPKELTSMFQPLYCKLCSAQLSSNIMAKSHYKSKNHDKKLRKWLVDYSQRTGEPLHKRAKMVSVKTADETEQDPRYFHCEVCDLPLTGKLHAESHYMGKNHQKAIMGFRRPAGKGFYNEEGKWVRQKPLPKTVLKDGEDTFGLAFRNEQQDSSSAVAAANAAAAAAAANGPSLVSQSKLYCDICFVGATCQSQLDTHYKGQKHQKRLRALRMTVNSDSFHDMDQGFSGDPSMVVLSSKDKNNFSAYRTPSGDYYCQTCNLTLNSEIQFKVHLNSKNHHKKTSQQAAQQKAINN